MLIHTNVFQYTPKGFERQPKLQKFTGQLQNFRRHISEQEFLIKASDLQMQNRSILLSALTGQGALAAAQLNARGGGRAPEVDHVTFELNGEYFSGWLGGCPFKTGDEVEVVASELEPGHHVVYGMLRPKDRLICMYPHAMRGIKAGIKNTIWLYSKMMMWILYWIFGAVALSFLKGKNGIGIIEILTAFAWIISFVVGIFMWYADNKKWRLLTPILVSWAFIPVVFGSLKYQIQEFLLRLAPGMSVGMYILILPPVIWFALRLKPFAHLAEQVFTCFGFSNVSNIDLVKNAKKQPLDWRAAGLVPDDYECDYDHGIERLAKDPSYNYGNPPCPIKANDYGTKFFRY